MKKKKEEEEEEEVLPYCELTLNIQTDYATVFEDHTLQLNRTTNFLFFLLHLFIKLSDFGVAPECVRARVCVFAASSPTLITCFRQSSDEDAWVRTELTRTDSRALWLLSSKEELLSNQRCGRRCPVPRSVTDAWKVCHHPVNPALSILH